MEKVTWATNMKAEIIEFSKKIKIDKIGFTSADIFFELKPYLFKRQQQGYASEFETANIEKRIDPKITLPEAKSIICIAIAYPNKLTNAPKGTKEEPRGIFCRSSWGSDYHAVLRNKLQQLEKFIKDRNRNAKCHIMVDTGPLLDRAVALRSGIGWLGKNCAVITAEFGSYVYLGSLLTSIPFPTDNPLPSRCGDCNKCLTACPTQAFVAPYELNSPKCLSAITQTKKEINTDLVTKIGNRLFGCDTCQTVCPYNQGLNSVHHEEFVTSGLAEKPELSSLLFLSNREFHKRFGHLAGSWRGRTPIQRNAIIGLVFFRAYQHIPKLQKLCSDPRGVISSTAKWAIKQLTYFEIMAKKRADDKNNLDH